MPAEEVWSKWDNTGYGCVLAKVSDSEWELIVKADAGLKYQTVTLDRKHLKDLFNAVGNEIKAF